MIFYVELNRSEYYEDKKIFHALIFINLYLQCARNKPYFVSVTKCLYAHN